VAEFTQEELAEIDRISDEICAILKNCRPVAATHALECVVASVFITGCVDAQSAMKASAIFGNAVSEYVADHFNIGANPNARN
jgi:hypothetical protein